MGDRLSYRPIGAQITELLAIIGSGKIKKGQEFDGFRFGSSPIRVVISATNIGKT